MEATYAHSGDVHDRLSQMRSRISSKKATADVLFFGHREAPETTQEALESILNSIKAQQKEEGSLDSTLH